MRKIAVILASILFIGTIGITGCVKNKQSTGYTFDDSELKKLAVGQTNKEQVIQYLGSPSTKSFFGNEIWYYVNRNYESRAFFDPKLVSQKIVAVSFNKEGLVSSIKNYDKNDSVNLSLNHEVTPTEGHDVGVLGQVLGNIGKFNSSRTPHPTGVPGQ